MFLRKTVDLWLQHVHKHTEICISILPDPPHTHTQTCVHTNTCTNTEIYWGKKEPVFLPLGTFEDSECVCVTQKPNIDTSRLTNVISPGVCFRLFR